MVILTSDFPATPNEDVAAAMRAVADAPRVAWIPPYTDRDGHFFDDARQRFSALGFDQIECVDIDEDKDDVQIAYLHEFDVIYLSGGDPLRFRFNAMRAGLSGRLRQCVSAGRLIVGTSGGALLLTPNVSLFRLQHETVDAVLATRGRFDALGVVDYELLPHAGRWDTAFLAKVHDYSACIDHDIVALHDGAAIVHRSPDRFDTIGSTTRYRKGQIIES